VKTVSIYGVATSPMNNYVRSGNSRYGIADDLANTKTDYTVSRDRSFTFVIDKGNFQDSQMVMESGKALARQLDEVVIPEVDNYRLATMSAAAVLAGGTNVVAVSASNAYSTFLDAATYLSDNKVPITNRVAFVSPAFYKFIKLDPSFVKNGDAGQNIVVTGEVGTVDGCKIILNLHLIYQLKLHLF
jgi:N4-gp56 family major capsid protein